MTSLELDHRPQAGLTLLELVIVLVIIGIASVLIGSRTGAFGYWKDEGQLRRLRETIEFLYNQAAVDQSYYELRIDFETQSFRVGVLRTEEEQIDEEVQAIAVDAGNLTLELAAFLNPSYNVAETLIPPPSMPSLAEPQQLPQGMSFESVRTMRGEFERKDGGHASLYFSPRGFSEFAYLHIQLSSGREITVLVNSFTGLTEQYDGFQEFEWSYGTNQATLASH